MLTSIVQDGTPRDCSSNRCGAQADTAIIRAGEVKSGKASPLGRTQGGGPVKAADMISEFMGAGGKTGGKSGTASSASNAQDAKDGTNTKRQQRREDIVAKSAGAGTKSGLPTVADDGTITMTFYQVWNSELVTLLTSLGQSRWCWPINCFNRSNFRWN